MTFCIDGREIIKSSILNGGSFEGGRSSNVVVQSYTVTFYVSSCVNGTTAVSGDAIRMFSPNHNLTGEKLICSSVPVANNGSFLLFYCLIIPLLVFLAILFPLDFYYYRLRHKRHWTSDKREFRRIGQVSAMGDSLDETVEEEKKPSKLQLLFNLFRFKGAITSKPEYKKNQKQNFNNEQLASSTIPILEQHSIANISVKNSKYENDTANIAWYDKKLSSCDQPISKPIHQCLNSDLYLSENDTPYGLQNFNKSEKRSVLNNMTTVQYDEKKSSALKTSQHTLHAQRKHAVVYEFDDDPASDLNCAHFDIDEEFNMQSSAPRSVPSNNNDLGVTYKVSPFGMHNMSSSAFIKITGKYKN